MLKKIPNKKATKSKNKFMLSFVKVIQKNQNKPLEEKKKDGVLQFRFFFCKEEKEKF